MENQTLISLDPPELRQQPATHLAGFLKRYPCESPAGIPDQWQQFASIVANHPTTTAYGVCYNFGEDGCFDYLTAIDFSDDLSQDLVTLNLPAQNYAVFAYAGPISDMRQVIRSIWSHDLAQANLTPVEAPMLEVYPPQFDANTGLGGFEVWIPIQGH